MPTVFVSGRFDDLRSRDVRFFEEASDFGDHPEKRAFCRARGIE